MLGADEPWGVTEVFKPFRTRRGLYRTDSLSMALGKVRKWRASVIEVGCR